MYDLSYALNHKDVTVGDKFGISWKVGKRRKLRSYRLLRFEHHDCDQCCDSFMVIEIQSGNKSQICDNHFRTGTFYLNP